MPRDSYPFPIYSGLLEPEHYNKISTAIWLFLWCISSVTKDKEDEEGVSWGIVLGNKPIKLEDLSEQFGVAKKTISRWIDTLEEHGYIRVTRAPYGLIFTVRNSKKYRNKMDKNVHSGEREETDMSTLEGREETDMSTLEGREETDMSTLLDKNVHSNKDIIKDLIITTPITTEFTEGFSEDSKADGMIGILNAYSKLHGKFDFHVKPREREAMGKMVAGGMPSPFTIQTMTFLLEEKRKREGSRFKLPSSFLYYVDAIEEAWLNSQTTNAPIVGVAPRAPEPSKRKTKQQQEIERLESIMREEEAKRA
ncbi:MarR family transcriptional regulator [Paenibacillus sp. IHBB 10380]|uniref:MarR family transcriptional regulator n=1 Tax=Paenibacillus sp. IHBB 10380 TaxID=1566358 RepID=UPI000698E665|nr:MarR family transcriptional regulator [Paenibacillus sp. IHBB 10380]